MMKTYIDCFEIGMGIDDMKQLKTIMEENLILIKKYKDLSNPKCVALSLVA